MAAKNRHCHQHRESVDDPVLQKAQKSFCSRLHIRRKIAFFKMRHVAPKNKKRFFVGFFVAAAAT
jgi:hypothetical protein